MLSPSFCLISIIIIIIIIIIIKIYFRVSNKREVFHLQYVYYAKCTKRENNGGDETRGAQFAVTFLCSLTAVKLFSRTES